MTKYIFVVLSLGILSSFSSTDAQKEMEPLKNFAVETMKVENSDWRIIRKEERNKEITYIFGKDRTSFILHIFQGSSSPEAESRMRQSLKLLQMGPGKELRNFGDEAYLQTSPSGSATIRFRKANVFIDLDAPSEEIALRIARKLADHIPQN